MILFKEDWDDEYFASAIVDTTGPNQSFFHYAVLLKEMGIKNWQWPIALLNPDLQGKDPHDPDLSREDKNAFSEEFKENPVAAFRLAVRAPGSTDHSPIYFEANRSNMASLWLFLNYIDICLIQPRQTGKTFFSKVLDTILANIVCVGSRTLLLTKDETLRSETLGDIKIITELLPDYLQQHRKKDIGNRDEFYVSSLNNKYKALIASNSPISAERTGRGQSSENVRVDETAYLPFLAMAVRTMLAATTAAKARADANGYPYANIFMTTAGKKDERDGRYAYDMYHDSAPWTEHYFDCQNREELHRVVKTASKDQETIRVHCAFSHRQLGYTDEWLFATARRNQYKIGSEEFNRDYLGHWTSGSQLSPFDPIDAARMRNSEREIQFAEISKFDQILVRWYVKESDIQRTMDNNYTITTVDTSGAMGRDDISFKVRSLKTGETIAACSTNKINLITMSHFFVDWLVRFKNTVFMIELRDQAPTIIDSMHKQMIAIKMNPFRRMYNTIVHNHIDPRMAELYEEIGIQRNWQNEQFLSGCKKYFGFATSGSGTTARGELYGGTLHQAVKYTGDNIYDKQTIDQILELQIINGRVDHPKGGHDDEVITWLLGYWFILYGKNLSYYGIPSNYVMAGNQVANSVTTMQEQYEQERNHEILQYIEDTMKTIRQEKNPYVTERLISDLEAVKQELGPSHEISRSMDEMITNLKKSSAINKLKHIVFR